MNRADRWLLPDGIEEMLPAEARRIEDLRRRLVNQFEAWGYDYVLPPMVEFTDSLLTGTGQDISLLTFKLTDQLSGKTMGIRADITPQVARMDAHSLAREGINRLCYAGHVMHTRPKAPLASRTPVQVGVELFGEPGLDGDIEVVSLLLSTLQTVGLSKQYLDLGHVGIYRALLDLCDFSAEQEASYLELLQAKALVELKAWLAKQKLESDVQEWLEALPRLSGSASILAKARVCFESAPDELHAAIDELEALAEVLSERYPNAQLYFDLGELRGHNYLTGIVFGAYAQGAGSAIASGGRYDDIGQAFGRTRPATGFTVDLTSISRLNVDSDREIGQAIFAPSSEKTEQWKKIEDLRSKGERVVCGLSGEAQPRDYQKCNRILIETSSGFEIQEIGS